MTKKTDKDERILCPVGKFFANLEHGETKQSKFFEHMGKSRMEFLKAMRSLIDEKISDIEKKSSRNKGGQKATKIEVE